MLCYQGMVVLAGNQVWWTWEVEDVFQKVKKGDKMGMKNYAKKMHKQIDELVVKVRKSLTACSKSANKSSTSCVRTACPRLSTTMEQAVDNL